MNIRRIKYKRFPAFITENTTPKSILAPEPTDPTEMAVLNCIAAEYEISYRLIHFEYNLYQLAVDAFEINGWVDELGNDGFYSHQFLPINAYIAIANKFKTDLPDGFIENPLVTVGDLVHLCKQMVSR
jgi:hypothetical protein